MELSQKPQVATLLNAHSTDTPGQPAEWNGGQGTLHIFGTWDGATVTMEGSLDGDNWDAINGISAFTDDYFGPVSDAGNCFIRANVSGVGTSSLTAKISPTIPR